MTAMIVFMVTLLASALNLGFPPDFLWHWTRAYFITCPVAGDVGFFRNPGDPAPDAADGSGNRRSSSKNLRRLRVTLLVRNL